MGQVAQHTTSLLEKEVLAGRPETTNLQGLGRPIRHLFIFPLLAVCPVSFPC